MSVERCPTSDSHSVENGNVSKNQKVAETMNGSDRTSNGTEGEYVDENETDNIKTPEIVSELYYHEYSIKTKKDERFDIRGLAVTRNPGHILVSDQRNKCIKYVDNQFNVIHRYTVVHEPWDVCVVDESYFVVTFPFVRLMQYFKFKDKSKIFAWFPIKSQNEYYGVCGDRDKIIATCKYDSNTMSSTPAVHVMDRQGNIELVIEKNGRGDTIFTDPNYIALDPSTQVIYVSDQGSRQIVSLNRLGRVLARFEVNVKPRGLTVDNASGNIFISHDDSLLLLNRNLKKLKTITSKGDKMQNVQALTYCSRTDRLIFNMEFCPFLGVFIV